MEVHMPILIEDVDRHEPLKSQQYPCRCMEDQIPPPKALVIVAHLSEEERRETEQNGKYLYFGRYLNGKAGFQHDGHRHRQHDPGHQEDVDPLLLDGKENELRCHHGLQGDEDDEMSENGKATR